MVVQATHELIEGLPDGIIIGEGLSIRVIVEGRRPRCFKYGKKSHVHSNCESRKKGAVPQKELQCVEGEKEKATGQTNKEHSRTQGNKNREVEVNSQTTEENDGMEYILVKSQKGKQPQLPTPYKKHTKLQSHKKKLPQNHPKFKAHYPFPLQNAVQNCVI